jgi:hypothetical protein
MQRRKVWLPLMLRLPLLRLQLSPLGPLLTPLRSPPMLKPSLMLRMLPLPPQLLLPLPPQLLLPLPPLLLLPSLPQLLLPSPPLLLRPSPLLLLLPSPLSKILLLPYKRR